MFYLDKLEMTDPSFDLKKLASKQARAKRRRATGADFLHIEAAKIIGERLAVTNREFNTPALLFEGAFSESIENALMAEKPPIKGSLKYTKNETILDLKPESQDLIISIFDLHRVNNLPGILLQIHNALKSDGLFMAIFPCENTLKEFRSSLLKAEAETLNGVSARIDLFPHIRQLGDLIRKIGFKLPVVDLEERTIRYSRLSRLIEDIRNTGFGNSALGEIHPLTRLTWEKTQGMYQQDHSDQDGKLRATLAMACISGWKEDKSQQKPMKPGSAANKLADFL